MDPGPYDLTITQGATLRKRIRWLTEAEDPDELPTPVDLTGWIARAQVRIRGSVALTFDSVEAADGTITLTSDGWIELYATHEAVSAARYGHGTWTLEVQPVGGDRDVLLAGTATIVQEGTL